jgi:hypothetical protein
MYARYEKHQFKEKSKYQLKEEQVHFFGHDGYIPWLLSKQTSVPCEWHLEIQSALAKTKYAGSTLVIYLKPKQKEKNLSLYEVLDVWGYSYKNCTPILLHLRGLFVDDDAKKVNREKFCIPDDLRKEPIYEFLYLKGSIVKGKLTGTWNPPPPSATNGALLWPDAVKYFVSCIRQRTPNVLGV